MICNKCGKEMGNEAFCPNCGAPASQPANANAPAPVPAAPVEEAAPGGFDIKKNLPIIGAVAAVIVILILIIALLGSGPKGKAKKLLNKLASAVVNEDVGDYLDTMPEYEIEHYKDVYGKKDYEDELEDNLKDMLDYLEDEYGKNIKMSFKITDCEKLDKDDLEDMEDDIKDWYDEKVDVTAAYEVEYDVTIKGKDDDDDDDGECVIAKIDGKWCIYSGGF